MSNRLKTVFLAIVGIVVLGFQVNAQTTANPLTMETILKQGPEYDLIKPLIGDWTVEMTVYKYGSRDILSQGTFRMQRKMMGNFLQETMTPMSDKDPNPFQRMSYFSYNRTNKRWEYTVFDTRFPITMFEKSDDHQITNNSITVYLDNFVAPPMWGDGHAGLLTKQRRVITFGKDENTNEQYMTFPGEEEFLAIRYVFKRAK